MSERLFDYDCAIILLIFCFHSNIRERHRHLFLLLDEIDLYYPKEREAVSQLLMIGKSTGHYAVASGSSQQLSNLAFCKVPKSEGFVNLNNTGAYHSNHSCPEFLVTLAVYMCVPI